MNVPYSMDDSEPDLYGSLGSYEQDYKNIEMEYIEIQKWYTQDDVNKLIKQHQKTIDEYRNEIIKLHEYINQHNI